MASTTGDSNLGAREGSIRRVLLVRDRRTNESWRYGFAEFATVQVCVFIILYFLTNNPLPSGCTSRRDPPQFLREIHHLVQAGPGQLHPRRCIRAGDESDGSHGKIHF